MNRYVTAILFFIALLFGLFVFFIQPHLESPREEERRGEFLLSFDSEQIKSINIWNGDEAIQIVRKGPSWQAKAKIQDRASPEVVTQLFEAASDLRIYDKISASEFGKKLNIRDFGLKWPKQRFQLGNQPEIWFGNDAAIRGRIYAQKQNSRAVYLVSDELQALISRPFNAFRDRQLTQWAPDQIQDFVVRRQGSELEIQQIGNRWKIIRPLDGRADSQKVYQFLDALLSAPILEFVDDDSGDLSRYGIDDQSTTITFKPNTGDPSATFRLGSAAGKEGNTYYAQFTGRNSVVRIPSSVANLLEINSGEFRERSLCQFNPDILDRISIRSGDRILTLNRKGEKWLAQTGNTEFLIPTERIQKFLSAFSKQEIKKFLTIPEDTAALYGLENPYASIEFYSVVSENTPEAQAGAHKLGSIHISSPMQDGLVYAQSSDSTEVLIIDPSILSLISADPAKWR